MYVQTIACVRKCKTPRKPLHFIKPYIERRRTRRDSLRSAGGSAEMHVIGLAPMPLLLWPYLPP